MTMLSKKLTIVLAEFDNKTGDPGFDDTLGQALGVSQRQSPYLNVLSDEKVEALSGLMGQPPETRDQLKVIVELCQRANSKAYIRGSIANMGSHVIGLAAVNCASGDVLAQEQIVAAEKEKVLDALGKTASKLRTGLGESLPSARRFDAPLTGDYAFAGRAEGVQPRLEHRARKGHTGGTEVLRACPRTGSELRPGDRECRHRLQQSWAGLTERTNI
jgi:hypothetical protein